MMTADGDEPAELTKLQKGYELLGELSRDEIVTVYVARDRLSGDEVTIKVLRATDTRGREALAHYASDARLLTALEHPNIVAVHSVKWLSENVVAVVTERVRGPSLRQVLDVAGTLPVTRATEVLKGLGRALTWAHSSQIMHRDVRPENVIFEDGTGRVVLSDFGLARRVETAQADGNADAYRAPELADGRYPDRRTDVYSLGIVGWELLTGRRPWPDTMDAIEPGQRAPGPPPLAAVRPGLPPALVSAIEGAVQLDRDRRITDVAAFLDRLTGVAPPPRPEPQDEDEDVDTFAVHPSEWLARPVPPLPSRAVPASAAPADPAPTAEAPGDGDIPAENERQVARERSPERTRERQVEREIEREIRASAQSEAVRESEPRLGQRDDREVARAAARDVEPKPAPADRLPTAGASRSVPAAEAADVAEQASGTPPPAPRPPSDSKRRKGKQTDAPTQAADPSQGEPRNEPPRGWPAWGPATASAGPESVAQPGRVGDRGTEAGNALPPGRTTASPIAAQRTSTPEPARPDASRESPLQDLTVPAAIAAGAAAALRGRAKRPTATPSEPTDPGRARSEGPTSGRPPSEGPISGRPPSEGPTFAGPTAAATGLGGQARDASPASPRQTEPEKPVTSAEPATQGVNQGVTPEAKAVEGAEPRSVEGEPGFDAFPDPFRAPLSGPVRGPIRGGPFEGPLPAPLGGPIDGPTLRPERMRGGLGTPRAAWGDTLRGDATRGQPLPVALDPVFDTPAEFPLPVMPDPRPMPADSGAGAAAERRSRWTRRGIGIGAIALLLIGGAVTLARMERAPDTSAGLMEPETPEGYGGDVEVNPPADSAGLTSPPGGATRASDPRGTGAAGRNSPTTPSRPSTTSGRAGRATSSQPAARPGTGGATGTTTPANRGANVATVPRSAAGAVRPAAPTPATRPPAASGAPPRTAARTPAAVNPARTSDERADGFARCSSPAMADQRACISAHLARNDAGLNQVYQDVIAAMRRRANTAPGDPDPPEVQRLRAAQRSWLVRRDTECRQRGRGREGPLWANERARCLEEVSLARGRDLSSTLARLRRD